MPLVDVHGDDALQFQMTQHSTPHMCNQQGPLDPEPKALNGPTQEKCLNPKPKP